MSDDKRQDQINRGQRARFLLENETFKEAIAEVDAEYVRQWRAEKKDGNRRESLWYGMNAVADVKTKLSKWISDGNVARQQVEEIEQRRKQQ